MTFQYMFRTFPIFGQILVLMAVLMCVGLMVNGIRLSKRTTLSRWQEAMWLRHLKGVTHREDPREHSTEDLRAAQRQWLQQLGAPSVGAGIGAVVGAIVSSAITLFALGAPFSLPFGLLWLWFVPVVWGILIGFAAGGIFAARRHVPSRSGDAAIATPEVSQNISDYRSPLWPLIITIPALIGTVLMVLVAPQYMPFSLVEVRYFALIPPPRWILALYPCILWLNVLLVECCVWARVKAPAAITSPDTALAHNLSIALVGQHVLLIYAGDCGVVYGMMLSICLTLPDASLDSLHLIVYVTSIVTGLLFMVVATLLKSSQGRLGGRLTGWLWTKHPVQRAASAEG